MAQAEGDGGVGLVVVVVVDLDLDARVGGEVGAVEAVGGEGALPAMDEPVGMLDDPGRVDAHVVGHHVAGEAEAGVGGAVLEGVVGFPAAEVFGDVVALQRVGGGDGVVVAAQALDGARRDAALPQADEPEAGDAAVGEQVEFFVGDLVEAMDVAEVFLGELFEPDVGALGHQDDVGHPGLVGGEGFVLVERGLVAVGVFLALELVPADELVADEAHVAPLRRAVAELVGAGRMEAHPDGEVFFAEDVDGEQDALEVVAEVGRPFFADEVELADEGIGRGERRARAERRRGCRSRARWAGAWRSSWGRLR